MIDGFIFFDTNYLQFENTAFTTTNFLTSTFSYAYDNRSDDGLVLANSITSDFIVDLGQTLTCDSFLILNHNNAGSIAIGSTTSGAWTTFTTFNNTNNASYLVSTQTSRYFKLTVTSADSLPAYFGEFVISNKKFQLANNPKVYSPKYTNIKNGNMLYNGRLMISNQANSMSFDLGYDYLIGDTDSMTGTDLQNLTELSRQSVSFLFYPNAGVSSGYADYYTFRPKDIFKMKITNDTVYEPAINARIDIIRCEFNLSEVK